MPSTSATPATIASTFVGLFQAVFNAPPPDLIYGAVVNVLNSANGPTLVGYINQFVEGASSKLSDSQLATLVMNNLLGKDPVNSTALHDALTELLAANHANRGLVISQAANLLAGLEHDATFGAAAQAWNARMHSALDHAGTVTLTGMTTIAPLEWM